MNINNFIRDIARYYMDFLETDFHKRSIPKRSIKYHDKNNALVGINLYPYKSLFNVICAKLTDPLSIENEIIIKKGQHTLKIKANLEDHIKQQIDSFPQELFKQIHNESHEISLEKRDAFLEDPDGFKTFVLDKISALLQKYIVGVILSKLEGVFSSMQQADDLSYRAKVELNDLLIEDLNHSITHVLNDFLINDDSKGLSIVLNDYLNEKIIKEKLYNYFSNFYIDDLYLALNDLEANLKLFDNLNLYLYLCDIKFNKNIYPIFYIPLEFIKSNNQFILKFSPNLFINKKAIEFIVQESKADLNLTHTSNLVGDRIIYLNKNDKLSSAMQPIINNLTNHFKFDKKLKISENHRPSLKSILVRISNNFNFCLFDKSDESLVNDYEEILNLFDNNDNQLADTFKTIISEFIEKEPIVLNSDIESEWEQKDTDDKLVYDTPIPLNEEQRKILQAINNNKCKFITVQGPPGTGKSHTITAVVFDHILKNKTTLVLSDKKEALDVVENKIVDTLNKVRINAEFQNPILRLGKAGNTYNKILTNTSIDRIKQHSLATKNGKSQLKTDLLYLDDKIRKNIISTVQNYSSIDIKKIKKHTDYEKQILKRDDTFANLDKEQKRKFSRFLKLFLSNLEDKKQSKIRKINNLYQSIKDELNISLQIKFIEILVACQKRMKSSNPIKIVNKLNMDIKIKLSSFLYEFNEMKKGIFGLFFKKRKLKSLNQKYNNEIDFSRFVDIQNDYQRLLTLEKLFSLFIGEFKAAGYFSDKKQANLFLHFAFLTYHTDIKKFLAFLKREKYLSTINDKVKEKFYRVVNEPYSTNLLANKTVINRIKLMKDYLILEIELMDKFGKIPQFDYVGEMNEKASLHTIQMANIIDERVITFYENNKTTAKILKEIIQKKQRFPRDKFNHIKKAFPCIIAGIRDYAEYIPLEKEAFDLIIIDEASQVSIAQAFPALLRAKKILVLGDNRQFGNVKTTHASSAINTKYIASIRESFIKNVSVDNEKLVRLSKFNIKTSILEFFEYVSNFDIMLKKHFRGYKELISFSSKYFYENSLQSIKIRTKRADDIIKFSIVKTDGKIGAGELTNTNDEESQFIINQLVEHVGNNDKVSVGIITPFTNQQRYLSGIIRKHPMYDAFIQKLKLKIMTFDSCQGEERDIIYYSMVAVVENDKLRYIFPKQLEKNKDIEENLRLQRLNVGFSRSKECMHFILSKNIEEFSGSVRVALMHYKNELNIAKKLPEAEDVDNKSPMEIKVLTWLKNSSFFKNNSKKIELKAQFPIGDYLKQINPLYQHPRYRCDFFLTYTAKNNEKKHIIIEYDGFKEHFIKAKDINEFNYQYYYKEDDIEREKILEGYGYKFLRLNRFNLGKNPEQTISKKLEYLLKKKTLYSAN